MSEITNYACSNAFAVKDLRAFQDWATNLDIGYRLLADGLVCLTLEDDWVDLMGLPPETDNMGEDEVMTWLAGDLAQHLPEGEVALLYGVSAATAENTVWLGAEARGVDHTGNVIEYTEKQLLKRVMRDFGVNRIRYNGVHASVLEVSE